MTKAIEAMAVAIWERDPDMNAPSDAVGKAEGIVAALKANGYAVVPVEFVESVSLAEMYLRTGVDTCERCGHETATADLDAAYELRDACAMIAAATPHDDGGE